MVVADTARLPRHTEQFAELRGWIEATTAERISVLDVGGGGSFYDFPASIRPRARRMVGVDPDSGVRQRPWLDEGHQDLVEEYAAGTTERFELALCVYVVEHVEAPGPFFEAIHSLLTPGGSCFGITPNLWHYFGLASMLASRAGLEDRILRWVRPAQLVEAYHSSVRYRCNTIRSLRATARAAGFRDAEFRVLEQAGMFETYFPPALRAWPRRYSALVNGWAPVELFGTLLFRLVA
jgi:2-polyprenyl-3-methyl-5-hydroxy-6-metoxy-1,4-benzoquinol methylase